MITRTKLKEFKKEEVATVGGFELLKDWGEFYEELTDLITFNLSQITSKFIFTHGEVKHYLYNKDLKKFQSNPNKQDIESIFGLAYTSSSAFAGLWVCNVQADLAINTNYSLIGLAFDIKTNKTIFIFNNKKDEMQHIYYNIDQLYNYIEEQKGAEKRKDLQYIYNNKNNIIKDCADIINKYAGKRYGEKTKLKLNTELRELTNKYYTLKYCYSTANTLCIEHYAAYYPHRINQNNNIEITNNNNIIQLVDLSLHITEQINNVEEANARSIETLKNLKQPLQDLYNTINSLLNDLRIIKNDEKLEDFAKLQSALYMAKWL